MFPEVGLNVPTQFVRGEKRQRQTVFGSAQPPKRVIRLGRDQQTKAGCRCSWPCRAISFHCLNVHLDPWLPNSSSCGSCAIRILFAAWTMLHMTGLAPCFAVRPLQRPSSHLVATREGQSQSQSVVLYFLPNYRSTCKDLISLRSV